MKIYYKFNFYINAKHSVDFGKGRSQIHPHTWETKISLGSSIEEELNFSLVENKLQAYFNRFEGIYLNELDHFSKKEPTMENIGKVFFNHIQLICKSLNLELLKIEISENPTRTYIIEA
ncbi:MAG: 6-carboxytetrahydropterin synthase [Clostridium sp.]